MTWQNGGTIYFPSQGLEYDKFWGGNLFGANGIVHHLWSLSLRYKGTFGRIKYLNLSRMQNPLL